jgi:4-nitrophenyl phosphatase
MRPAWVRGFLFDMDGVLYRGSRALPGARALLASLGRRGVPFALVTNNSTRTPRQYARLLAGMGMRVPEARIVTSAVAVAAYLGERLRPGSRVLLIGEPSFRRVLERAGFVLTGRADAAAVVVGLDRRLTYRKLAGAVAALHRGARFVVSNPDPALPVEDGLLPGAGSIVAALRYATGRTPVIIGKPRPRLLREAMARVGLRRRETAMVGDQVSTDVAAGRAAGLFTVLVLTGVSAASGRRAGRGLRPDLTVRDLRALGRWYARR